MRVITSSLILIKPQMGRGLYKIGESENFGHGFFASCISSSTSGSSEKSSVGLKD